MTVECMFLLSEHEALRTTSEYEAATAATETPSDHSYLQPWTLQMQPKPPDKELLAPLFLCVGPMEWLPMENTVKKVRWF